MPKPLNPFGFLGGSPKPLSAPVLSGQTVKRLIRSVKADPKLSKTVNFEPNGKIQRDAMKSYFMPREPLTMKVIRGVMNRKNGGAMGEFKIPPPKLGVKIAKGDFERSMMPEGVLNRPTAILPHEVGHAEDHAAGTWNRTIMDKVSDALGAQPFPSTILRRERAANTHAIARLKSVGASDGEVQGYRAGAKKAFNTYRSAIVRGHVAQSGFFKDLLPGKGTIKSRLKPRMEAMIGVRTPTLSEHKKAFRAIPELRGYGFAGRDLVTELRLVADRGNLLRRLTGETEFARGEQAMKFVRATGSRMGPVGRAASRGNLMSFMKRLELNGGDPASRRVAAGMMQRRRDGIADAIQRQRSQGMPGVLSAL